LNPPIMSVPQTSAQKQQLSTKNLNNSRLVVDAVELVHPAQVLLQYVLVREGLVAVLYRALVTVRHLVDAVLVQGQRPFPGEHLHKQLREIGVQDSKKTVGEIGMESIPIVRFWKNINANIKMKSHYTQHLKIHRETNKYTLLHPGKSHSYMCTTPPAAAAATLFAVPCRPKGNCSVPRAEGEVPKREIEEEQKSRRKK